MLRKILIAFFVVFLLFAGAAAYLFYKIRPGIRAALAQNEATRKMLHPRVVTGEGEFEKRAFYAGDGLGEISQILVGWPANREGAEIAVVGNHGTDFIDFTGIVRKQVRY